MDSKDKSVVSVLSLAASAIAVICFVTGRSTLSDFLSPHPASATAPRFLTTPGASGPVSASPSMAEQTEQMLVQTAFFIHEGHPAGRGGDDYDADDHEDDRQKLISSLERYIVAAQRLPQERGRLARAEALLRQLNKMHPAPSPIGSG